MADERGERTEQPTGKRLSEAREHGQVAHSGEVGPAMTVLAAAGFLSWMGPAWADALLRIVPLGLAELSAGAWEAADAEQFFGRVLSRFVAATVPLMLAIAALVLIAGVLQSGFVLSAHPLRPNFAKLSPLQGLKNLFGGRALMELAKAPIKLLLLGGLAWLTVRGELSTVLTAAGRDPVVGARAIGGLALTLLWRLGLAHAALAALDYGYQRWSHRRSMRMTREEVKEEVKQQEGDPQIRARFRSLHRQYAMRRMMAAVPKANVVVTNPTHLAIALRYDAGTMKAPRVVAKGARLIAERIRAVAREHGVPVVEHKPLAQALYKAVPIGGEIPGRLYRAVAEILAYVWTLDRRLR